jgi:hypothetical protein
MLLPITSSLVFLAFLQLVPGRTSYQPNQLRMMIPYSLPDEWMVQPEELDTLTYKQPDDTLTNRQTRSMRYKGKTGLADKGEFEAGGCHFTFFE